jgi:hypothetical protein
MRSRTPCRYHKNVTGEHRVPTKLVRYQTGNKGGAPGRAPREPLTLKVGYELLTLSSSLTVGGGIERAACSFALR